MLFEAALFIEKLVNCLRIMFFSNKKALFSSHFQRFFLNKIFYFIF